MKVKLRIDLENENHTILHLTEEEAIELYKKLGNYFGKTDTFIPYAVPFVSPDPKDWIITC